VVTERRPAILVVEDEALLQSTLSAFLTLHHFTTFRGSDVEQAEKILERERIHAVTLDIKLPDARGTKRNGFTLLTEEEEALALRLHAEVIYKPDPYRLVVEGLTRLLARAD
jgi:DNA-binding NtrC family response regulator